MRVHNVGWKTFWDSTREWSCLKWRLDYVAVTFSRFTWQECWQCPVFACYALTFALQLREKKHGKNLNQGSRKVPCGQDSICHDRLLRVVDPGLPAVGDPGQRSVIMIKNNESSHYTASSILLLILSLLDPNIFPSTVFPSALNQCFFWMWETALHVHVKRQA